MHIYVASSWRNQYQPTVVELLRSHHVVYDFRQPVYGESEFHWSEISPNWRAWTPKAYRDALLHPAAQKKYQRDLDAMTAADATLLVMPCGLSSHLELGWACGAERITAIFYPPPEHVGHTLKPELMSLLADRIIIGWDELRSWSAELQEREMNA